MKTLKQTLAALLIAAGTLAAQAENKKPFTIPEVKEWKGAEGTFAPTERTRIVYTGNNKRTVDALKRFAHDYKTMFGRGFEIVSAKAGKGDFVFRLENKKTLKQEAYNIKIGDKTEVTAASDKGIFAATRTLLQLAALNPNHAMPRGTIKDEPAYDVRGFMIDCGRKFIPMRTLRQYLHMMAYYKMNTLHIHLNDNGFKQYFNNKWEDTPAAFRMQCDTYPGLTARDGFYTKKEFVDLQTLADSLNIEIIPEIDVPAHTLAFTHYKPQIASKEYGADHLDLFNPETYTFLDALFKEYLEGENPVFRGKYMHIGTDEYSNKDKNVVEKFRYFTDRYIKYVESFGKKAMIWGQQTHAKGETPIKVKDVVMQIWNNPYAQPKEMVERGYDIISIPDELVYIVPQTGYYYDYLDTQALYKSWTPAHVASEVFPEQHPKLRGGMFAVWNDHVGNGVTVQDIHYRIFPALQTLSTKMWTAAATTFTYEQFDSLRQNVAEAPDVNAAGRHKPGIVLAKAQIVPGETLPIEQIGWNYNVTFDIDYRDELPGTVLFSSDDARFYLSDPISEFLGFSTDGYLNNFAYRMLPGEKAQITIKGNREETCLYIDGKLIRRLDVRKQPPAKGYHPMRQSRTLVFPLKHAGKHFNSKITNLKVTALP